MSFYTFAPSPAKMPVYAYWENGFTDKQIQQIIEIGESLNLKDSTVNMLENSETLSDVRKCKVSWISLNQSTLWLYDSLAYSIRQLNSQVFNFDITGFFEDMQYTVYGSGKDHYNWHTDQVDDLEITPRKLSLILQLSNPSEYEGGDLELMTNRNPIKLKKEKGLICMFPPWVLHRVTPVTSGTRKTLVVWATGPKFK
jgi:PKHD-type hydroxylase